MGWIWVFSTPSIYGVFIALRHDTIATWNAVLYAMTLLASTHAIEIVE